MSLTALPLVNYFSRLCLSHCGPAATEVQKLGIQKGDVVGILARNTRELFESHWAVPMPQAVLLTCADSRPGRRLCLVVSNTVPFTNFVYGRGPGWCRFRGLYHLQCARYSNAVVGFCRSRPGCHRCCVRRFNFRLDAETIRYSLEFAKAKVFFVDSAFAGPVKEARARASETRRAVL